MLRRITRLTPAGISVFTDHTQIDQNRLAMPPRKEPETGWERVKAMYSMNDLGEPSLEVHHVAQSTFSGCFIGACYGGFIKSRQAYIYFIENNQATIFKSTQEAKKILQDYVTVAFAKGAYTFGWKIGLFTFLFSITSTTISVYRGNTSLIEYIAAGAIAGGLYKANLGLAATLVGASVGAFLSMVAGGIIITLLKVAGATVEDVHRSMYKIKEAREKQMYEVKEKASEIKNDDLTRHHDKLVEEKGVVTINDIDS